MSGDQEMWEQVGTSVGVVPQPIVVGRALWQQAGLRIDPPAPSLKHAPGPDLGFGRQDTAEASGTKGITAGAEASLLMDHVRPRAGPGGPARRAQLGAKPGQIVGPPCPYLHPVDVGIRADLIGWELTHGNERAGPDDPREGYHQEEHATYGRTPGRGAR